MKKFDNSITVENADNIGNLSTSNGSISAEVFALDEDVKFSTSNGSIKLYLAGNLNANLNAKTTNGRVKLHNFELNVSDVGASYLVGKLGYGGKELKVRTSNSSIHFYKIAN